MPVQPATAVFAGHGGQRIGQSCQLASTSQPWLFATLIRTSSHSIDAGVISIDSSQEVDGQTREQCSCPVLPCIAYAGLSNGLGKPAISLCRSHSQKHVCHHCALLSAIQPHAGCNLVWAPADADPVPALAPLVRGCSHAAVWMG